MATLYFNSEASGSYDGDYGNLGNWFLDNSFTIPAISLPTASDDIEISSFVYYDSSYTSDSVGVSNANVIGYSYLDYGFSLLVSGVISFYDYSSSNATIYGNASAYYPVTKPLGGTITGSVSYYGYQPNFATPSLLSPFTGTGVSYSFDGQSGLKYENTGQFAVGTGDFTIEWFQKMTSFDNFPRVFAIGAYPSTSIGVSIEGGTFYFWDSNGPHFGYDVSSVLNQWVHFRIVRASGTLTGYLNGVSFSSESNSNNISDSSTPLSIGCELVSGFALSENTGFRGNISNFRWESVALNTGNFTPPSSPLVSDSNTILLVAGLEIVNPINGSIAYWNLNNNGSGGVSLLDSTGNGNTLTNNGSIGLTAGIIDGAVITNSGASPLYSPVTNSPTTAQTNSVWFKSQNFDGGAGYGILLVDGSTGTNIAGHNDGTAKLDVWDASGQHTLSSGIVNDGEWHHAVGIKDTDTAYLYIDGVLADSTPFDLSTSYTPWGGGNDFYELMSFPDFNGNCAAGTAIDEAVVWDRALSSTEVSALYNSGTGRAYVFPNVAPYPAGAIAAWHFNDDGNGGVSLEDATGNGKTLIGSSSSGASLGNGIIQGDAVFDGTNSLQTNDSISTNGSISFSGWFNMPSTQQSPYTRIVEYGSALNGFTIEINTDGTIIKFVTLYEGFATELEITGFSFNTWNHITIIIDEVTLTKSVYLNGILNNQSSIGNGIYLTDKFYFARYGAEPLGYNLTGSIDESGLWNRALTPFEVAYIYNYGAALTYPFNPPPSPIAAGCRAYWNLNNDGSGNVSLVDSTGNGNTLTNQDGVTIGTGIIEGCGVFSSSFLKSTSSSLNFGSNDFSFSSWVNLSTLDLFNPIFANYDVFSTDSYYFGCFPDNKLGFYIANAGGFVSSPIVFDQTNLWIHVALIRSGSQFTIYINGISESSGSFSGDIGSTNLFKIGGSDTPCWNGSIDEVGVWSRALSQEEVSDLYNNGMGLTYPFIPPTPSTMRKISLGTLLNLPFPVDAIYDKRPIFGVSTLLNTPFYINK